MKNIVGSVCLVLFALIAAAYPHTPTVEAEADDSEMLREQYLERMRALNAPGTVAPDFDVILPDGTPSTLSQLVAPEGETILVLYDPDCDICHHYLQSLREDPAQQRAVVVIDVATDSRLMARDASLNPESWKFASAAVDIEEAPLYYIENIPTVYVIDATRTILRKINIEQ